MILILSAFAQVTPVGPFTGELSEGFEGFPFTTAALDCAQDAFGGNADVCAPDANVGGVQIRDELFLGACLATPHAGSKLAGSNDGRIEITFTTPLSRFGGRFTTHAATAGNVLIEAYDVDGIELGSLNEPLAACGWTWQGLQTDGRSIASVVIRHTLNGGALVDLDGLQADTPCGLGAPDADADGVAACVDCDDADPNVFSGAVETCNGTDDDCNGTVDDGLGEGPASTVQDGVCADSLQICEAGAWVDPDPSGFHGYEATENSCDGLDNDCDGSVDDIDEIPAVGGGMGVCALLEPTCDGTAWVDPVDWTVVGHEPEEATCDGLDNDCDGEVDEDLEPPEADLNIGACAGQVKICDGAWLEPDPSGLPDYAVQEICDELDNDCDGEVDEDCVKESGCATFSSRVPYLGRR